MGQVAALDNYEEANQPETKESIWDKNTMDRVKEFAKLAEEISDSRAALNAKLAAGKTALIDDGFNKDALEAAIKYAKTPEEKRENFDLTYLFCRKALGTPIQDDLFSVATQQQVKVTTTRADESE